VLAEHIAHRAIGNPVADVSKSIGDAVVTPAWILASELNDQLLDLTGSFFDAGLLKIIECGILFRRPPYGNHNDCIWSNRKECPMCWTRTDAEM
jgi:hypothetical protein